MAGTASAINRISADVIHQICSNQVVVDLKTCIKELVENSLDAHATNIEVRLVEHGIESIEVRDNGSGIAKTDFECITKKHATSKLRAFSDLHSNLSTMGFRGEALSSLCALSELVSICTRTANDQSGTLLEFGRGGEILSRKDLAREVGTTVTLRGLFRGMPVRHKEFVRTAKTQQVGASVHLLQAYALIHGKVAFRVTNETNTGRQRRDPLLATSGKNATLKSAASAVLGSRTVADMRSLNVKKEVEEEREEGKRGQEDEEDGGAGADKDGKVPGQGGERDGLTTEDENGKRANTDAVSSSSSYSLGASEKPSGRANSFETPATTVSAASSSSTSPPAHATAAAAAEGAVKRKQPTCLWRLDGLISSASKGRRTGDLQFFFLNKRPVETPKKIGRAINESFSQVSSRLVPAFVLDLSLDLQNFDVNVTPDKRTVLIEREAEIAEAIRERLTAVLAPSTESANFVSLTTFFKPVGGASQEGFKKEEGAEGGRTEGEGTKRKRNPDLPVEEKEEGDERERPATKKERGLPQALSKKLKEGTADHTDRASTAVKRHREEDEEESDDADERKEETEGEQRNPKTSRGNVIKWVGLPSSSSSSRSAEREKDNKEEEEGEDEEQEESPPAPSLSSAAADGPDRGGKRLKRPPETVGSEASEQEEAEKGGEEKDVEIVAVSARQPTRVAPNGLSLSLSSQHQQQQQNTASPLRISIHSEEEDSEKTEDEDEEEEEEEEDHRRGKENRGSQEKQNERERRVDVLAEQQIEEKDTKLQVSEKERRDRPNSSKAGLGISTSVQVIHAPEEKRVRGDTDVIEGEGRESEEEEDREGSDEPDSPSSRPHGGPLVIEWGSSAAPGPSSSSSSASVSAPLSARAGAPAVVPVHIPADAEQRGDEDKQMEGERGVNEDEQMDDVQMIEIGGGTEGKEEEDEEKAEPPSARSRSRSLMKVQNLQGGGVAVIRCFGEDSPTSSPRAGAGAKNDRETSVSAARVASPPRSPAPLFGDDEDERESEKEIEPTEEQEGRGEDRKHQTGVHAETEKTSPSAPSPAVGESASPSSSSPTHQGGPKVPTSQVRLDVNAFLTRQRKRLSKKVQAGAGQEGERRGGSSSYPAAAAAPAVRSGSGGRSLVVGEGQSDGGGICRGKERQSEGRLSEGSQAGGGMRLRFEKSDFLRLRLCGQFNRGFILTALFPREEDEHLQSGFEGKEKERVGSRKRGSGKVTLFIVDQHAADEKKRFEELNLHTAIKTQPLLAPLYLQLTPAQEQVAKHQSPVFSLNGFRLHFNDEKPPGRRVALTAVPYLFAGRAALGEEDVQCLLHSLADRPYLTGSSSEDHEETNREEQRDEGQAAHPHSHSHGGEGEGCCCVPPSPMPQRRTPPSDKKDDPPSSSSSSPRAHEDKDADDASPVSSERLWASHSLEEGDGVVGDIQTEMRPSLPLLLPGEDEEEAAEGENEDGGRDESGEAQSSSSSSAASSSSSKTVKVKVEEKAAVVVKKEGTQKEKEKPKVPLWKGGGGVPRPPRLWAFLASRACRTAIMVGQPLGPRDMRQVVDNLAVLEHPWNCPHGRPSLCHLFDVDEGADTSSSSFKGGERERQRQRRKRGETQNCWTFPKPFAGLRWTLSRGWLDEEEEKGESEEEDET
uniref:MutL C-terminal dimerisation domain-containing protein n=1 Tax=Chromera velia CCMP2878 TaxID=1169474 RepID=A0A0G4GHC1_9ALVE|eukprot:Cvel_4713.t1-p1 / transcript=Cvel_4713.t1 / gene=Cvel_4713 / organism=Chromera_velia_CCMP2878 / gene_product=DNA mismatch repair protein PMS1, putative / transcript_product=DNA mismatch repair protein PMS1, putative / location=Cvel_scaffold209:86200-94591(+) / protein_length=1635 / sequence_SO=supercontig / SO=protein_coding / is_pseudo=false